MVTLNNSNTMSSKRLKNSVDQTNVEIETDASLDRKILASDINDMIQVNSRPTTNTYHDSVSGSILYSIPTNSPDEIFSYIRHNDFQAFRRSLDVYHQDIIALRNERQQTVLHMLVILAHPYLWVRLLIMRGCDPCAQDIDGFTAAHYAAERDDVEMLKAVTVRFQSQAKPISDEQVTEIHQKCLKALTLKDQRGLTAFMIACQRESIKSLNYLIELNLNDGNVQDNYGDTCLHYAVARRNLSLVEILIEKCHVDVNGGATSRPSVLDILQFNRQNAKPNEQKLDDKIELILLKNRARHRCSIRRIASKRKSADENEEKVTSNLSTLTLITTSNINNETAKSHARLASLLENQGDLIGAKENYQNAMKFTMIESIEWTDYAYHLARLHQTSGERDIALELLEKALEIRIKQENHGETIDRFKQEIENLRQQIS